MPVNFSKTITVYQPKISDRLRPNFLTIKNESGIKGDCLGPCFLFDHEIPRPIPRITSGPAVIIEHFKGQDSQGSRKRFVKATKGTVLLLTFDYFLLQFFTQCFRLLILPYGHGQGPVGQIGIGKAPSYKLDIALATEDFSIEDAGSAAATEQDWIQVRVGGNVGYIRVFAAK